jgi:hypothetical protein
MTDSHANIPAVLNLSSEIQMVGSNAWRVVAVVKNMLAVRDGAVVE